MIGDCAIEAVCVDKDCTFASSRTGYPPCVEVGNTSSWAFPRRIFASGVTVVYETSVAVSTFDTVRVMIAYSVVKTVVVKLRVV